MAILCPKEEKGGSTRPPLLQLPSRLALGDSVPTHTGKSGPSCQGSAGPRPACEGVPGWADTGARRPQDHSRAHSHTRAPTSPGERTHSPRITHEETEAQSRMTHSFNSRSWAASQQNSNPRIFLRQRSAPEQQGRVWFTLSSLLGPQHPAYV